MSTSIRPQLMELLTSQPGVPVHVQTVAEALGVEPSAVANGLRTLSYSEGNGITRASRGFYVFNPTNGHDTPAAEDKAVPAPTEASTAKRKVRQPPRAVKVLKLLNDGKLLLEAGGDLWVAERLEV